MEMQRGGWYFSAGWRRQPPFSRPGHLTMRYAHYMTLRELVLIL
jgi:hypothetical protein